jgi:diguanylate cyclase (GGDEF)-like protein/PAS domain S-box-containing protein
MTVSLRLLCIEDNPADTLLLIRHLSNEGYAVEYERVDSYPGLEAALEKSWNAVLADYNIPGMDFGKTMLRIQEHDIDLPVILVSGNIGEEKAVDLLNQGAWDFVLKENLTRLGATLQHCLNEAENHFARREAEKALKANEAKFRTYFEQSPVMMMVTDAVGRFVDANPTALTALGWDRSVMRDSFITDIVAGEDRELAWADLAGSPDGNRAESQCRLRRRDGSTFPVSLRTSRLGDDRFMAFAQDISERQQAEDKLRLMAAVFNATQEGVAVTDLEGRVLAVNEAFTTITEYAEAEVMGRSLSVLSSGRHTPDFYQSMTRDLREAGYWQGEIWDRRKGGEIYPQWLTISTIRDAAGRPEKYVGVFTDISRIKHTTTHLEHLAHYDALTDLPNRLLLKSRLCSSLDRARRYGGAGAVMFLDLDRFKEINDSMGHQVGDELLQLVAGRLRARLRDVDTLARLGGDEFVVALDGIASRDPAAQIAQTIIDLLHQPFELKDGRKAEIGCSLGISLYPQDGDNVELLLERADQALYEVKRMGRNGYRFYR